MNLNTPKAIVLSAAFVVISGCSNGASFKNLLVSKTTPAESSTDPLANVPGEVSEEFLAAKQELKAPEQTLLQFARWREDMGDHVEAMNRYREILKANDQCVAARLGIARVEQATGRTEAAEKILQATAQKYPERSDVWISMGQLQASKNNYPAAIESLKKAVDLNSQDQGARYELGLAYANNGQVSLAQPHLAYAVGESAASYNIGYVLNDLGRTQEAIQWFERAIASQPDERTLQSTKKMLASLKSGPSNTMMAQRRVPSTVDVELTNYEAYRETPEVAVEPQSRQTMANTVGRSAQQTGISQSPFRQAVQSKVVGVPDGSLRSAMSALARQAGETQPHSVPVQEVPGRARVDSVPNWKGPSTSATAAPLIQTNREAAEASFVEPQAW